MRTFSSAYMHWAKTASRANINLALSDLSHVSLAELGLGIEELELTGPSPYGYRPLVEALAALNGVSPESVVVSLGTSMANHLAMAALIGPGDDVLIESPGYELLASTAAYLGATVRCFPRPAPAFTVDPDDVRRAMTRSTKLVVVTNLHNPTSARIPDATLSAIGTIAADAGAHVLVDEVYLDALFDAEHRPAIHLGTPFVVTNSLTKVYGLSGLRCGWILAAPALAGRIWRLTDLFYNMPAHLAERASVVALRELPRLRERARALLATNIAMFNDFLAAEQGRLACAAHRHGLVAFPEVVGGSADELCALLLRRYDTSVVPGSFFGAPAHVRIGLGRETATLAAGLKNISAALRELRKA